VNATESTAPATHWQNSIVSYGDVDPATLTAHPENWRQHPRRQADALGAVLSDVGWIAPVIVNQTTGHLLDGHLRLDLARARGEATVPVAYVALTPAQEAEALLTFDPLAGLAEAARPQLQALLAQVAARSVALDPAVQVLLDRLAEQVDLYGAAPVRDLPETDPDGEWDGMPEFAQDNLRPVRQILMSFATEEDAAAFAALIGAHLTPKTRDLWYPPRPLQHPATHVYVSAPA